jgi:hypothetical protein
MAFWSADNHKKRSGSLQAGFPGWSGVRIPDESKAKSEDALARPGIRNILEGDVPHPGPVSFRESVTSERADHATFADD